PGVDLEPVLPLRRGPLREPLPRVPRRGLGRGAEDDGAGDVEGEVRAHGAGDRSRVPVREGAGAWGWMSAGTRGRVSSVARGFRCRVPSHASPLRASPVRRASRAPEAPT